MNTHLEKLLSFKQSAEYSDIRCENRKSTVILAKGSGLDINETSESGYFIRSFINGKWRSAAFENSQDVLNSKSLNEVQSQPKTTISPSLIPGKKRDVVIPRLHQKLSEVSTEAKKETILEYMKMIVPCKNVCNFQINYREDISKKAFMNCNERYIYSESEKALCIITVFTESNYGIRAATEVLTSSGSFGDICDGKERIEKMLSFLTEPVSSYSLNCKPVTIICDRQLSGSLIHESVGHVLEADYNLGNAELAKQVNEVKDLCSPLLTIIDDPNLNENEKTGHYEYDDEGVEAQRKVLVQNGKVKNKLHNLKTGFANGVPSTGNGRAVGYKYFPIVRMSNIYAQEGEHSFSEMIANTDKGLFLQGLGGGYLTNGNLYYRVNGGRIIENGKLSGTIGNLLIESSVLNFLRNIDMVGNEIHSGPSAFCIKEGQAYLPLWNGAPCLRINNVTVKKINY